jgi:hypothetical protein
LDAAVGIPASIKLPTAPVKKTLPDRRRIGRRSVDKLDDAIGIAGNHLNADPAIAGQVMLEQLAAVAVKLGARPISTRHAKLIAVDRPAAAPDRAPGVAEHIGRAVIDQIELGEVVLIALAQGGGRSFYRRLAGKVRTSSPESAGPWSGSAGGAWRAATVASNATGNSSQRDSPDIREILPRAGGHRHPRRNRANKLNRNSKSWRLASGTLEKAKRLFHHHSFMSF